LGSGQAPVIAPISFTSQPPLDTRIEGTVTDAHGVAVAGAIVSAYRSSDTWLPARQTVTDASGKYVVDNAGLGIAYRIRFAGPAGAGLVTEWYNDMPARRDAADLVTTPTQPVVDADAALAGGGSLTGSVSGPGGVPVPNVVVRVYRTTDMWVGTYQGTTASDGSYRIAGVRPDTALRIRFSPPAGSGLAAEWFDDFPTRGTATEVTVGANASVRADAQLAAAP
jgi:hypothetical protein